MKAKTTSDEVVSQIRSVVIVIWMLSYSDPNTKTNDVSEIRMMKFNAIGWSSK